MKMSPHQVHAISPGFIGVQERKKVVSQFYCLLRWPRFLLYNLLFIALFVYFIPSHYCDDLGFLYYIFFSLLL